MSSQQKQTSSTTNASPWNVQTPYLQDAFSQAQGALGQAQGAINPTDFVSQFSPDQLATFQKMVGYGNNNSGIPQSSADASTALNSSGSSAATQGLYGLGGWTPSGGTDSNITAASKYADNPYISGQVDAAMRDADRNASENVIPGIERNAANTGNTNSNKTALAEGVVQRGLNDQRGDISAQLRSQAYNNGLNLAEQNSESTNNNMLSKFASLIGGGTGAVNSGVNAGSSSIGQQGGLFNIAGQGGAGETAANQAKLDNTIQQSQWQTQQPFNALNEYYNIIGNKNWGGTSTSNGTETTTPSTLSTIGGLMGAGGSLFGSKGTATGGGASGLLGLLSMFA